MTLRPDRFLVVAVVREIDENGREINEHLIHGTDGQPSTVVGGVDGLIRWANAFEDKLADLELPGETPPEPVTPAPVTAKRAPRRASSVKRRRR